MPYTMRTYAQEVLQRLDRYDVAKHVDFGMLETVINLARLDVQMATLQAVPERYSRLHRPPNVPVFSAVDSARLREVDAATGTLRTTVNRVGVVNLPEDFIVEVAVGYDYYENLWPARGVSKRDLYTTLTKSFTKPTERNPIYCIEKLIGNTATNLLFCAGGTLPTVGGKIEIWYLAKLPWLQISTSAGTSDVEVRIGYDLQELVILISCLRIMETISGADARNLIRQDVEMALSAIERQYEGQIDRSRLLVEARESTIPSQPIIDANATRM